MHLSKGSSPAMPRASRCHESMKNCETVKNIEMIVRVMSQVIICSVWVLALNAAINWESQVGIREAPVC